VSAPRLTPYLCVEDGRAALAWYAEALGAQVGEPWVADDGRIGHAELTVHGARVFLAESHPEFGVEPPDTRRGAAVTLALEVDDCAAVLERVRAAGGTVTREPEAQPERVVATFLDPSGHRWMIVEERQA
jgi:uncharacterized glyoxalase superfamily protein PhnB